MAETIDYQTLKKVTGDNEGGEEHVTGVFIKSPDATVWEIKVANDGTVSAESQ